MISSQVLVVQDARRWFASISFWFRNEYIALVRSFTIIGEIIIANYLIAVTYRNRHFVPTCDGSKKVLSSSFYWFFLKNIYSERGSELSRVTWVSVCVWRPHTYVRCLPQLLSTWFLHSEPLTEFKVHWFGPLARQQGSWICLPSLLSTEMTSYPTTLGSFCAVTGDQTQALMLSAGTFLTKTSYELSST